MDDADIITGIIHKNESALSFLIDKYGGLVKSIVRYHLKDLSKYHEDCMQDILLSIWQNVKSYDESKNSFKNWIGAISKYKCIDYRRKYYSELNSCELDENIVDITEITELDNDINSILDCLKPNDRELFYRHYILGEKVEQIAKSKNKNSGFFYNRLSKGRRKILSALQGGKLYEK